MAKQEQEYLLQDREITIMRLHQLYRTLSKFGKIDFHHFNFNLLGERFKVIKDYNVKDTDWRGWLEVRFGHYSTCNYYNNVKKSQEALESLSNGEISIEMAKIGWKFKGLINDRMIGYFYCNDKYMINDLIKQYKEDHKRVKEELPKLDELDKLHNLLINSPFLKSVLPKMEDDDRRNSDRKETWEKLEYEQKNILKRIERLLILKSILIELDTPESRLVTLLE